jgi:hypothetical protein
MNTVQKINKIANDNCLIRENSKFCFIAKIKGLADETKHLKRLLHKKRSAESISRLDASKHQIKYDTRHYLLAYAYMRGKEYSSVERKCASYNRPNPYLILKIIGASLYIGLSESNGFSINDINLWLNGV